MSARGSPSLISVDGNATGDPGTWLASEWWSHLHCYDRRPGRAARSILSITIMEENPTMDTSARVTTYTS